MIVVNTRFYTCAPTVTDPPPYRFPTLCIYAAALAAKQARNLGNVRAITLCRDPSQGCGGCGFNDALSVLPSHLAETRKDLMVGELVDSLTKGVSSSSSEDGGQKIGYIQVRKASWNEWLLLKQGKITWFNLGCVVVIVLILIRFGRIIKRNWSMGMSELDPLKVLKYCGYWRIKVE